MADNLTVKGDAASAGISMPSKKDSEVDRDKADLDRLRQVAKKSSGKNLSDDVLRAIRSRRKTKIAEQKRLGETKESFAANQSKEKLSHKATERQTQAQKAAGTEKATRTGELGEKESKNVRSNPRSGPKLPATLAKPTTQQEASKLLDKIFTFVEIDGEPLDRQRYGDSLRAQPPTQPKADKQANKESSGKTPAQNPSQTKGSLDKGLPSNLAQYSAKMTSGGRGSASTQPGSGGRATGQPTGKPTGKPAQPMGKEATGPSLGRPTTSTTFRMGGPGPMARSTGVSPDGLYNAGGALITNSSFDGANFNWDAFQWFFTLMVMQDLHKYRKMMKELRRLQGKSTLFGKKLREAIEDMRQTFDRNNATAKFFESVKSAFGNIKDSMDKIKLDEAMGEKQGKIDAKKQEISNLKAELAKNQETVKADKAKLEELKTKGGDAEKIAQLQKKAEDGETRSEELSGDIETKNGELGELKTELEDLRRAGKGKGGKLEDLAEELSGLDKDASQEQLEQFQKNLEDYASTIESLMAQKSAAPMVEQRGRDLSAQLRSSLEEVAQRGEQRTTLESELAGLDDDVEDNAAKIKELKEQLKELDEKDEAHEILAMKVIIHESVMAAITKPQSRIKAVNAAQKARADSEAREKNYADKADKTQDADEKNELLFKVMEENRIQADLNLALQGCGVDEEVPGSGVHAGGGMLHALEEAGEGELSAWTLINGARGDDGKFSADEIKQVHASGQFLRNNREGQIWAKIGKLAEKGGDLLNKMAEATEGAKGEAEQAVNTVIEHSNQITLEGKQEANRALRQTSSRTQGMINQLMQISRMARSSS